MLSVHHYLLLIDSVERARDAMVLQAGRKTRFAYEHDGMVSSASKQTGKTKQTEGV